MKKILASTLLCSSLLLAANSNYDYEITPMIGIVDSEGDMNLENQKAYGLSIGKYIDDVYFFDQIEIGFLNSTNTDYTDSGDTKVTRFFTNLIKEYQVTSKTSLYGLAGLGYEDYSNERFNNEDDAFGNYGIGLKYKISDSISLKTDIRHLISFEGNNSLLYTIGFGFAFGEKAKPTVEKEPMKEEEEEKMPLDDDQDGIYNRDDICPNTPRGIAVNNKGCEFDSDKDKLIDRLDKCPYSAPGAVVDKFGCDNVVNLDIQFDKDSATITNQYDNRLNEFATYLNKRPNLNANIEAHTDSDGTNEYNQILSQKRAQSTIKALGELDVDTTRLKAVGHGEDKPVASNETSEGKALNRRVEAVIIK